MAVFDDLASSANLMIAGKFIDVVGSLGGNTQEQSDAELAINGHPCQVCFGRSIAAKGYGESVLNVYPYTED